MCVCVCVCVCVRACVCTCVRACACVGWNFGWIPPLTAELAAHERLKFDVSTFLFSEQFHFNLYGLPVLCTSESCYCTAPHCRTDSGLYRPKTISAWDSSAQIIFYWGSSGRTAFSGNNFDFGTSIEVKRTVSEYHNQNYCQRVLHSKGLQRSVKIERNDRLYHNQTNCHEV